MTLIIDPRDFQINLFTLDGQDILRKPMVGYYVDILRWDAKGGPSLGKLRATGPTYELWELGENLMRKIIILSPRGVPVWWGYISEVVIWYATLRVSISLEPMYNEVKVTYVKKTGAGNARSKAETSWYSNPESIARYGSKKLKMSISEATDSEAENLAQTVLERTKYPVPLTTYGSTIAEPYAEIYLEGWWGTLDRDYYSSDLGYDAYTDLGDGVQEVGESSSNQYVGQSFQISTSEGWDAKIINIRCRKEGSPTDYFRVELCQDNAGNPGSVIEYTDILGSTLPDNYNWLEVELPDWVSLAPSTTYWIVCRRSGSVNGTNYYMVDVNEELGYTAGVLKIYSGSWGSRTPNADMNFSILGTEDTSIKIARIVEEMGTYFIGVTVESTSGVYASPYEEGDVRTLRTLENLLDRGTDNNLRYLVEVNSDLYCTVKEEPVKPEPTDPIYHLYADGRVNDNFDKPLAEGKIPVGVWALLKDVIPATFDSTSLADTSSVFIESCEYSGSAGRLRVIPRGLPKVLDLQRGLA